MVDTVVPNKVRFGLKDVVVIPVATDDGSALTYGTGFSQPGAVSLSLNANGDKFTKFADDGTLVSIDNNQGYAGNITITAIVDAFREQVLGEVVDANGGHLEKADQQGHAFALAFKISGDKHNNRYLLYNVSATRPDIASATKTASIDSQDQELPITVAPDYDQKVKYDMPEDKTTTMLAWATAQLTAPVEP
ncbi:major tail protein [Oenococcus sicerae]|uniref:Phage tail protein n=1 Tax=Oenococcus sicerae TaxID=2203724 RepID=A0AAJ1R8N5_9LACO|nr:major tail protein [Oenococcus sicerae]MDN6899575.1 phage tail protein [Oenococcus sicerae]